MWGHTCSWSKSQLNTWRNNNVVMSIWRHFDVITSKWRRFDVITTSLLRDASAESVRRGLNLKVTYLILLFQTYTLLWPYNSGTMTRSWQCYPLRTTSPSELTPCTWYVVSGYQVSIEETKNMHNYNNSTVCSTVCSGLQQRKHAVNVLDNWQLTALPQSGGSDFDPRWVHDNLSVPL